MNIPRVFDLDADERLMNQQGLINQELRDGQRRIEKDIALLRKDIQEIKDAVILAVLSHVGGVQ